MQRTHEQVFERYSRGVHTQLGALAGSLGCTHAALATAAQLTGRAAPIVAKHSNNHVAERRRAP